jgi:hypothetical protein
MMLGPFKDFASIAMKIASSKWSKSGDAGLIK